MGLAIYLLPIAYAAMTQTVPSPADAPVLAPGERLSESTSLVVQGRQSRARSRAIRKALAAAVLDAGREAVKPAARPALESRLRAFAETDFRKFIVSYRVLSEGFEGRQRSGLYRVRLAVKLNIGLLRGSVRRMQRPAGPAPPAATPTIRIAPFSGPAGPASQAGPSASHTVARALKRALDAAGFKTSARSGSGTGSTGTVLTVTVPCSWAAQGTVGHGPVHGATLSCTARLSGALFGEAGAALPVSTSGLHPTAAGARSAAMELMGIALARAVEQRVHALAKTSAGVWRIRLKGPLDLDEQLAVLAALVQLVPVVAEIRPVLFARGRLHALLRTSAPSANLGLALASAAIPSFRLKVSTAGPRTLVIEASPSPPAAEGTPSGGTP